MRKIPTIFKRNPDDMSKLLNEPHDDCGWVFDGEGVATRKYDGTCCLMKSGRLFKRREVKKGKTIPAGFIEADHDRVTGKRVGWLEVDFSAPEDKYHAEAFDGRLPDGTYELLGEKIQGNPEGVSEYFLLKHSDAEVYENVPRNYNELRDWFAGKDIEGIVFHHDDGRMAKIKKRDFGLKRHD